MPELPEVETIKKDLEKVLLGRRIKEVIVNSKKVIKQPVSVQEFRKKLIGNSFKEVLRKGKVLIFKLKEKLYLVIHLRISGWILFGKQEENARVVFVLDNNKHLNYMDTRLLGELRVVSDYTTLNFIKQLGPEIFDMNLEEFKNMIKKKKKKIKVLLMDQSFIAGIGNIYSAETLFRAKIKPTRLASSLNDKEITSLFNSIKEVLQEAIKFRGSSVDSYRDIEGREGKMEERLKVYGRENKPCFVCKTPIKRIELGGRSTYFCPRCQR